jgi:GTP-binding protein EngB required for normal cell division
MFNFTKQLHSMMPIDARTAATTETPMQQDARIFGQNAVSQLTSYEQRDLLDAVDKLRRANISGEDFSIPQIVVCGDQSSGKSSVLEAISQLRFPVGAGTTTRFATEVVLRNDSLASDMPVTLRIIAQKSRTSEQKAHIEGFTFEIDIDEREAFSNALSAALTYLESYEPGTKFWYDRLHVEISGPKQPNLTLVDLPGLIHAEISVNSGDSKKIKDLVNRYINEPKAIVLAVVRADLDIENQEVVQLVKNSSDAVTRTIGVLTWTDKLTPGSDQEENAVLLACNKKIYLGAGWHVLRNMNHQAKDNVSFEQRDEVEREFFSTLPWTRLDPKNKGIAALREKLSLSLFDCITHDLSDFVNTMNRRLDEYRSRHDKLGAARESSDSQSYHLQRIQKELQSLVQDALDGRTDRSDFASFFDGSSNRALWTTINRYSHKFATRMRGEGKQYDVYSALSERNE